MMHYEKDEIYLSDEKFRFSSNSKKVDKIIYTVYTLYIYGLI